MAERGHRDVPILAVLLRDAQPRWVEIEGESDARKREERHRAFDIARDELVRFYSEAETDGRLAELDPRIRALCEEWMAENGGLLPRRKGGAPRDEHFRMMLHMAVRHRIATGTSRTADHALHTVAEQAGRSYELVRAIFYDPDPEWQRAAAAEWARLNYEAGGQPMAPVDAKPKAVYRVERRRKRRD